jgi:hypothetical protein
MSNDPGGEITHADDGGKLVSVCNGVKIGSGQLEHDPEKWKPVFRKDHAPPKS